MKDSDLSANRPWLVEDGDADSPVELANGIALLAHVSEMFTQPHGRVSVSQETGERPMWQRLLGLKGNYVSPAFQLEWSGDVASLIFMDDTGSEYRAMDPENPVSPDVETRSRIAHGEAEPHPVDECLCKDRAVQAVREFVEKIERPEWLKYRYVR